MGRKRKKEKGKAPSEPAPESEAAAPWWKRRRVLAGGGAFLVALAVFLLWASTLPGYESPLQETNRCKNRIERISTAMVQWARAHEEEYAPDLRTLSAEGFLPGQESIYVCPASGKPYTVESGIRVDMPGSAVLVACPHDGSHRLDLRSRDRNVVHLIHFIGADGRLHYEMRKEDVSPKIASEAVRRAFRHRLKDQRDTLALTARVMAGEKGAASELARLASFSRRAGGSRALALWGMGRSGLSDFLPILKREMADNRGAITDEGLVTARALLRLGDDTGVPYLISALGDDHSSAFREAARDALVEAFHDADPPLPDMRAYAPEPFRSESVLGVAAWWESYPGK